MKMSLIQIIIFISVLATTIDVFGLDIDQIKADITKKQGEKRYKFILSSIGQIHQDSFDIKADILRSAIKTTNKKDIYLGRIYIELAKNLLKDGKQGSALDTIFLAKNHINITNDSIALGNFYFILSLYYDGLTDFDKAINSIDTAIQIFQNINETISLSLSYNRKGVYCHKKQDWKNGIMFYEKALKINSKMGNKKLIYNSYYNLALIYKNIKQRRN